MLLPTVVCAAALLLLRSARRNRLNLLDHDERVRRLADDERLEREMHGYIETITAFVLDRQLPHSPADSDVRAVARGITLNVLRNLDPVRQREILRFLREISIGRTASASMRGGMASDDHESVPDTWLFSLDGAELPDLGARADWSRTYLVGIAPHKWHFEEMDFESADLRGAFLVGVNAERANFEYANLRDATLTAANTHGAELSHADLSEAYLRYAEFYDAKLRYTHLQGADLFDTALDGAILYYADLRDADLEEASLRGASLVGANLNGARHLTPRQLAVVNSLFLTTMPDGRKWDGAPHGPYTVQDLEPYFLQTPDENERHDE